ncbi:MAG: hypothetical protein IKJ39_00285 [Lachnospiraceae bacterium]|nr:hypothetical protein [Lachnospiraceae bacterium]
MNTLIEKLEQIDFGTLDIDEILDNRDAKVFDAEWIRVYEVVEAIKNNENYSEVEKQNNTKIRERVFLMIYEYTKDADLAGYISDDFGLIADAKLLGYNDVWLDKMVSCYENSIIPCGSL